MSGPKVVQIASAIYYGDESPVFGERSLKISIDDDEAGGAFIVLENTQGERISIDPDELDLICAEAKRLLNQYPQEDV